MVNLFMHGSGLHPENVCRGGIYQLLKISRGGAVMCGTQQTCLGGEGGGTRPFLLVQLRGVRMCREVVGLTVWDVVLPGGMLPWKYFLRWML